MKPSSEEIIEEAVNKWLDSMISTLATSVATSYIGGANHAGGYLGIGVGFKVLEQDAVNYAKEYKKRLMEEGVISVTRVVEYEDGKIGYEVEDYPWLKDRAAITRKEIGDIISNGIAEGKPTGIRVSRNGTYPKGSIAEDLRLYFDIQRSDASTVARTETARCYYEGEIRRYQDAGVEYVEYSGGPNACDICEQFIGSVFKIGSEPHIPIHPNCRCDYIPYFPEPTEISPNE